MSEGAVAERTVRLHNTSDAPLYVERVGASCGCTTTQAPQSIPPQGSAPLTVRFDSHNRVGPIHQSVRLYLAGHQAPLTISTTGQVARDIAFSARSLDLGDGTSGAPATLTVTRVDNKPLSVSLVKAPHPLRARVKQVSPSSARLVVSFAAPSLAGVQEKEITLGLNCPGLPATTIPVRWATPGLYQMTPEQVNFGVVSPGTARKQQVRLSGADVSKLRVLSCQGGVSAHLLRRAGSRQAVLSIVYRPKGGQGSLLRGHVVLATGEARQPRLIVPVYAAVSNVDQPRVSP